MHRIVVWDPTGKFPEGYVLDGDNGLGVIHSKGGITLPVEPELLVQHAVSGFFMKKFGTGVPFTRMVGTRACPMLLFASPDYTTISWVARLTLFGETSRGTFRLTTHSGMPGAVSGGLLANGDAIEISEKPLDKYGGITIGGTCRLNCTTDGYLGLSLYGVAIGARVTWSAVSQSR